VVVEVPVQVTLADGTPARGLTAANFELLEGRRRQRIVGFEVIDLAELGEDAAGPSWVPLPARRHFLLLFDLSFSDPTAIARAREAARRVVAEALHPSDLVAVATYSLQGGASLVLGFTPDRAQLEAAIEDLGLRAPAEAVNDPLRLVAVSPRSLEVSLRDSANAAGPGPAAGSKLSRAARDAIFSDLVRNLSIATTRGQQDIHRGYATTMVGDFQLLADQLRWVEGRKHVVLLSEGVDSSLLLGTEDAGRISELSNAAASGEFWRVDSNERFGSSAAMSALGTMLDAFRRSDATVHAVDIGGLRAGPDDVSRSAGEDSLFMMAAGTGGELYRNFNDLGQAMERMLERTSVTYVLTFQPEEIELDGTFRPIRVRLKGGPAGARLVHRPGYYAPLPYQQTSAEARRATAAQLLLGGEVGGPIPVGVLAAPTRGAGGLARVPLLLEIDGPAVLAGAGERGKAVLEIFCYALTPDGQVRDFVSQHLALDLERLREKLGRGLKYRAHMELPPGEFTLRTLVRDVATGRSTVQQTALAVPRFEEGSPSLLPPLFADGGESWLVVGEAQGAAGSGDPFTLDGRPFLPAARPTIAAGGEAELVLVAYHAAAEGRRLEGRLFDRSGNEVASATLRRVGEAPAEPGETGAQRIRAVLQAPELRPGEYRLEVRLVDPGSGDVLVSALPLRLVS
jgi:VWFA-related protein